MQRFEVDMFFSFGNYFGNMFVQTVIVTYGAVLV